MARGLMQNAAPAPAGPPQGAMPADEGSPPGAGAGAPTPGPNGQRGAATDEEKALYRDFLANTIDAIYQPETAESLANILRSVAETQGVASAIEPMAQIVSGIVGRVAYDGLANGLPISREMAAAAAASLAGDLGTNLAESAGVPPLSNEHIQAIYLRSMELLADQRDQVRQERASQGEGQQPQEAPPGGGNGLMMSRPPNRKARRAQAAQQRRQARA